MCAVAWCSLCLLTGAPCGHGKQEEASGDGDSGVGSVGGGQMLREAGSWALSSMNFPDPHEKPLI